MARRVEMALGQGSLFDGCTDSINFGRVDILIPSLLDERPIGTTPTGLPMYRGDEAGAMYKVDKREVDFETEMSSLFKKINTEVLVMQKKGDKRPIFYIPEKTRILVEPRSLKSKPYNADTVDRFFAVRNDIVIFDIEDHIKSRKIAYEPLERFSRRVLIRKADDDFSDLRDQPVNIAKDRKFFIPKKYLEGERYFNLTEARVSDDFDKFCDFIKRSDSTAQRLR